MLLLGLGRSWPLLAAPGSPRLVAPGCLWPLLAGRPCRCSWLLVLLIACSGASQLVLLAVSASGCEALGMSLVVFDTTREHGASDVIFSGCEAPHHHHRNLRAHRLCVRALLACQDIGPSTRIGTRAHALAHARMSVDERATAWPSTHSGRNADCRNNAYTTE